jgi:chromosome segregation ATPase
MRIFFSLIAEDADSELADFKAWFDYVSHKFSDPKVCSTTILLKYVLYLLFNVADSFQFSQVLSLTNGSDIQGEERNSKTMEGEVRRLQHEYEKLASEKSSELSTLLAENKFVWNQYKIMENDYTSKLRSEHSEVELANEKIKKLLASVEQLQSLNDEKDETIATLRTKVYKKEADSNKLNEENLRLSQELDLLKKSRSSLVTPVLNRCTAGAKPFCLRDKNSIRDRSNVIVKKEPSAAQAKDTEKVPKN